MNTLNFTLQGFHCDSCIKLSTLKLKKIPGVTNVKIEGLNGKTELQSEQPVTLAQVQEVLKDTEYTVK